ncbi:MULTISPECIES: hypothetical protein [Sulfolobaceae]|nr:MULTISPECIES: hypothetical protein [unclassified Sulfolobus]
MKANCNIKQDYITSMADIINEVNKKRDEVYKIKKIVINRW